MGAESQHVAPNPHLLPHVLTESLTRSLVYTLTYSLTHPCTHALDLGHYLTEELTCRFMQV